MVLPFSNFVTLGKHLSNLNGKAKIIIHTLYIEYGVLGPHPLQYIDSCYY